MMSIDQPGPGALATGKGAGDGGRGPPRRSVELQKGHYIDPTDLGVNLLSQGRRQCRFRLIVSSSSFPIFEGC